MRLFNLLPRLGRGLQRARAETDARLGNFIRYQQLELQGQAKERKVVMVPTQRSFGNPEPQTP